MSERVRLGAWQLAHLAECGEPDRADVLGDSGSAGAQFLRSVEDGATELYDSLREDYDGEPEDWADYVSQWADYSGGVHEIADGAPDIYTHGRWAQFFDLGAYNEEPSEIQGEGDMTQLAGVCLYLIAQRLVWALLAQWAEDDAETMVAA